MNFDKGTIEAANNMAWPDWDDTQIQKSSDAMNLMKSRGKSDNQTSGGNKDLEAFDKMVKQGAEQSDTLTHKGSTSIKHGNQDVFVGVQTRKKTEDGNTVEFLEVNAAVKDDNGNFRNLSEADQEKAGIKQQDVVEAAAKYLRGKGNEVNGNIVS